MLLRFFLFFLMAGSVFIGDDGKFVYCGKYTGHLRDYLFPTWHVYSAIVVERRARISQGRDMHNVFLSLIYVYGYIGVYKQYAKPIPTARLQNKTIRSLSHKGYVYETIELIPRLSPITVDS